MGAYISTEQCRTDYNITLNCTVNLNRPEQKDRSIGNYTWGNVPADGDVAGIGIVSMFICVTSVALVMSAMDILWRFSKFAGWKSRPTQQEKAKRLKRSCGGISFSELLEALVLSCSDQQVFTGGAYALTLRYWKGCSITAYHYSIVANMMLLTCATHLLSVAIVRHYWRYPWLALLRIFIVTGVFAFTGLLLSNMKATGEDVFPSKVPPSNEKDSPYFAMAACFQGGTGKFGKAFLESVKDNESAKQAFLFTTPGNRIEGWNFYLITLICYFGAIIVETVRFVRRSARTQAYLCSLFGLKKPGLGKWTVKVAKFIYGAWVLGCVATSGVTIGFEAKYMMDLRRWVKDSGWLERDEWGNSAEDDATSFGQLVPVFLGLLTLFTFMQSISEMGSRGHHPSRTRPEDGESSSMDQYKPLPHGPAPMSDVSLSAIPVSQTLPTDDSNNAPARPQRSSTMPVRPHFLDRDSRESGAALLGGSLESPHSPSTVLSTPALDSISRHSEMTLNSSYFPASPATVTPLSPSGQRSSIPRRPVGGSPSVSTSSPAQVRHQSFA